MLRVEVANKKLEIDWEHDVREGWTQCVIDGMGAPYPRAYGTALKHPDDPYVKETGRKISLAKALSQIFTNDVAARAIVWQAYFARKGAK